MEMVFSTQIVVTSFTQLHNYTITWLQDYTITQLYDNTMTQLYNDTTTLTRRLDAWMAIKDSVLGYEDGKTCGLV